jgi:flagellin
VDDRKALQSEVTQLRDEIDRIAKGASFNGKKLLDGSFTAAAFQVGAGSGENITVGSLADTRAAGLSKVAFSQNAAAQIADGTDATVTTFATAIASGLTIQVGGATAIDIGAIAAASSGKERLGQVVEAINRKTSDTGVSVFLTDKGNGTYDLDVVGSKTTAAGVAEVITFAGFTAANSGIIAANASTTAASAAADIKGIDAIDVTTDKKAWIAIRKLDSALDQVNSARGTLGAVQSRFENAVGNIQIQAENTSAARGRIMDADFASETSNLSRAQILQQAGTAMVAQANQLPQQVLALLR